MTKTLAALRRLGPEDAAIWRAVRLRALSAAPGAFAEAHDDWAARPLEDFAAHLGNVPVFVAEAGGRVLGCAELTPDDGAARGCRGWIESVFVCPEARGMGVADALLAALAREAGAQGLRELCLDVGAGNAAALRAYDRAGFRPMTPRPAGADAGCEVTLRRVLD